MRVTDWRSKRTPVVKSGGGAKLSLKAATVVMSIVGAALLGLVNEGYAETPAAGKWVQIDKTQQVLRAYENGRLVLKTRVSTGRRGGPPRGEYAAGVKYRMHYSRLYHHAPMPFSVQISGNYFIHGYHIVPPYPASHGCVRVPLTGDNPAGQFYDWVEEGTPIEITGHWAGKPASDRITARPH